MAQVQVKLSVGIFEFYDSTDPSKKIKGNNYCILADLFPPGVSKSIWKAKTGYTTIIDFYNKTHRFPKE